MKRNKKIKNKRNKRKNKSTRRNPNQFNKLKDRELEELNLDSFIFFIYKKTK